MKAPDTRTIIESFPHPTISQILGKPTYDQIDKVETKMKTNAASVATELGGGVHGHLGMLMSEAEYATISRIPFAPPENPGLQPIIPPNTTAAQTDHLICAHETQ